MKVYSLSSQGSRLSAEIYFPTGTRNAHVEILTQVRQLKVTNLVYNGWRSLFMLVSGPQIECQSALQAKKHVHRLRLLRPAPAGSNLN